MIKVDLQDLGTIKKEILWFVLKNGEASYTNLKTHLEENSICSEKTFVAHKSQLEAGNILGKKLSEKTGRPTYFIPAKVRRNVQQFLEKEEAKRQFNNALEENTKLAFKALELLNNPKVARALKRWTNEDLAREEGRALYLELENKVAELLHNYCESHNKKPEDVVKKAIRQHILR